MPDLGVDPRLTFSAEEGSACDSLNTKSMVDSPWVAARIMAVLFTSATESVNPRYSPYRSSSLCPWFLY